MVLEALNLNISTNVALAYNTKIKISVKRPEGLSFIFCYDLIVQVHSLPITVYIGDGETEKW